MYMYILIIIIFVDAPSTSTGIYHEDMQIDYKQKAESICNFYQACTPNASPEMVEKLRSHIGNPSMEVIKRDLDILVKCKTPNISDPPPFDKKACIKNNLRKKFVSRIIRPCVKAIDGSERVLHSSTDGNIWNKMGKNRRTTTLVNYNENLKMSNTIGYDSDTLTVNVISSVMPRVLECPKCKKKFPTRLYGVLAITEDTWAEHLDKCILGIDNSKIEVKDNIMYDAEKFMYYCKKCKVPYKKPSFLARHIKNCKW